MKRNHTGHRVGEWHQKVKHSDETVKIAREMFESGKTCKQIGGELSVPWRTVFDWVTYATRSTA